MYSISQVAKVLREITQYLQDNPLFFSKEGVFRLSGSQTAAKEIVDNILQNKPFKKKRFLIRNVNNFPIHDYISACKLVLNDSNLLNPEDLGVQFLKESLMTSDPEQGAHILKDYLEELLKSTDENELLVGEILQHYFQLAALTLTFEEKNKMNAGNLGKVLGPNIEKLINNDPEQIGILILKLNEVCAHMLQMDKLQLIPPKPVVKNRKRLGL